MWPLAGVVAERGLMKRKGGPLLELLLAMLLTMVFGLDPLCAAQGSPTIHSQQGRTIARPGSGAQSEQREAPGHPVLELPGATRQGKSLSLPQVWHPSVERPLPPAPPTLAAPVIPVNRLGCWKGRPNGFDSFTWLTNNPLLYSVGSPGEMVVCFRGNTAYVPHAEVYISPAKRALDIALQLGLSYTTFDAHSIHTDIYSITPTQIHLRFQLTLEAKAHLLFLIPIHVLDEPVTEDVVATSVAPDTALVQAREVLYVESKPVHSATWHAYFRRIDDKSAP